MLITQPSNHRKLMDDNTGFTKSGLLMEPACLQLKSH